MILQCSIKGFEFHMKKIYILLLCAVLLSSCSLLTVVNPTAAPTREATGSPTAPHAPTATPITPTLTFTATPPLVGQRTRTPTPTLDFTPTQVTGTPLFLLTPDTPTPSVEMKGFVAVNISEKEFYKGAKCQPASVKFSAQVADPANTAFVVLFVRFKSKQTGTTSEWTSITMQSIGAGTYTYDLISEVMKAVDLFENAWVQYQFVATNSNSREIGRTDIFSEKLTLLECETTPTPAPTPTATVLKP
jgi:hypothetical protein